MSELPGIPPSEIPEISGEISGSLEMVTNEISPKEVHNNFVNGLKDRWQKVGSEFAGGVGLALIGQAGKEFAIRADIAAKWGNETLSQLLTPELVDKFTQAVPNIAEFTKMAVGEPKYLGSAMFIAVGCAVAGKAVYEGYKAHKGLKEKGVKI
jgi:hypothetical protein